MPNNLQPLTSPTSNLNLSHVLTNLLLPITAAASQPRDRRRRAPYPPDSFAT
jgi:hypothetical protein